MKEKNVVPKKLGKEPLIEAICELRFKSDKDSISDLLPGLIFQKFSARFPKVEKLPASNIPTAFLKSDPNLCYTPTIKLIGDQFSTMIGENVFSLSCSKPYVGWNNFSALIMELFSFLNETSLITHSERVSLKYIDILLDKDKFMLDDLNLNFEIGGDRITTEPVQLRFELNTDKFINIIQIGHPAKAILSNGETFHGILIDVDTISLIMPKDFLINPKDFIDYAHSINKSRFFNLLKAETIKRLDPEY
jgi:uncharacterized protein (TIGR04255 family)